MELKRLKKIIKEEIGDFDWAQDVLAASPDDEEFAAMLNHFGANLVYAEDFEETDNYDYLGGKTYDVDGQTWVVLTKEQADKALKDDIESLYDDLGGAELVRDISDYVTVSQNWIDDFCDGETDHYIENFSEDNGGGDDDVFDSMSDDEYKERYDSISEEIDDLENLFDDADDEGEDNIQTKINHLVHQKDKIVEEALDILREEFKDEAQTCMKDPIYCLVEEKGWYSTTKELLDIMLTQWGWDIDEERLVDDLFSESNYDSMGYGVYAEETVEDTDYILIRMD
jgi:hypothetical protein